MAIGWNPLIGFYGKMQPKSGTFYDERGVLRQDVISAIDQLEGEKYFGSKIGAIDWEALMQDLESRPGTPGATPVNGSGLSLVNPDWQYLNADLAKHYGMSKETAYQEALSNTAYQRSIADMKAAGLNPAAIFGAGKGSGADGVSLVRSAVPSGSGGSGRRYSGSSSSDENLFSPELYNAVPNLVGLGAAIITGNFGNYYAGQSAAKGIMQVINALNR